MLGFQRKAQPAEPPPAVAAPLLCVEDHAGLRSARAKLAELSARRNRCQADLQAARTNAEEVAQRRRAARVSSLLGGDFNPDAETSAAEEMRRLENDFDASAEACRQQTAEVQRQYGEACRQIVVAMMPELAAVEARYYELIVELAEIAEAKENWLELARRAGVSQQMLLNAAGRAVQFGGLLVGACGDSVNWNTPLGLALREGLRRGLVRVGDLSQKWADTIPHAL